MKEMCVIAARAEQLRCPRYVSAKAIELRSVASTANAVRDWITFAVTDWHGKGGIIRTAQGDALDIGLMEHAGIEHVRSDRGKIVMVDQRDKVELVQLEDAFKASSRRTINRLLARGKTAGSYRVDRRILPLVFWTDVALKIMCRQDS